MTPRYLKNIHTARSSCRDAFPCSNVALKLPQCFYLLMEKALVHYFKFGLLTIRWHSAIRKHLFLYPQGDRSGLRKPKKDKHQHSYHQHSSPKISLNWSNNKARFSFNQPNRKRWGAKLVDIKYLPHKAFFIVTPSLEGWPTKAKEVSLVVSF